MDVVTDSFRWPEMPKGVDPKIAQYLRDMQRAVEDRFARTLSIPGDLSVGGYLILQDSNRIRTRT